MAAFCDARGIPTADLKLVQRSLGEQVGHTPARIEIEIVVPSEFPERYRTAVARAAESCKVKRTLASPPEVAVVVRVRQAEYATAT